MLKKTLRMSITLLLLFALLNRPIFSMSDTASTISCYSKGSIEDDDEDDDMKQLPLY